MANFNGFIKNIQKRAEEVEVGASRVKVRAALAISQTVILATPVKSGHARANWQIGLGAGVRNELDDEDVGGNRTIRKNKSTIRAAIPRQPIFISNLVPYIHELNGGSSSQAPAAFVQIAVQEALSAVARAKVFRR